MHAVARVVLHTEERKLWHGLERRVSAGIHKHLILIHTLQEITQVTDYKQTIAEIQYQVTTLQYGALLQNPV